MINLKLHSVLLLILIFIALIPNNSVQGQTTIKDDKYFASSQNRVKKVVVTTLDTVQSTGFILALDDSLLVLWQPDESIDEKNIYENSKLFHASEIYRISLSWKDRKTKTGVVKGAILGGAFGFHMVYMNFDPHKEGYVFLVAPLIIPAMALPGALVGAIVDGISNSNENWLINGSIEKFQTIQGVLRKNCILQGMPDNLLYTLEQAGKGDINSELKRQLDRSISTRRKSASSRKNIVHISYSTCHTFTDFGNSVEDAFVFSGFGECRPENEQGQSKKYPLVQDRQVVSTIGLEIDLTSHFRLGLAMTKNSTKMKGCGEYEESEYLVITTSSFFLEYVNTSLSPIFKDRIEFSIASGVSYCGLFAARDLFGLVDSYEALEYNYTFSRNVYGGYLRLGMDVYLTRNISIPLRIEGRSIPRVTVPALTQTKQGTNITKILSSHDVNGSAVDLSVGLRFHF